jgi:putative ABC transport system permease protein
VETLEDATLYFQELEDRLRALPGVTEVGAADQMPFSGGWSAPPVSMETTEGVWDGILNLPTVTPAYFDVMEIPLLEGRALSLDDGPDSEPVVVVSQALAERMAPGASPLGLRIRGNWGDSIWRTVVGVVGDVRYRLNFGNHAMAYVPAAQDPTFLDNWVIRTASDPLALAPAIHRVREKLDPEGTSRVVALQDNIRGSEAVLEARFSVILLGGLATVAALLAIFGVYGVLAYVVQLRSREIGIQLALGAEHRKVLGGVLGRGLFMGVMGLAAGGLLALALGRFLESQLFGVEPWDPQSLILAALLLLASTVAASYLPARRASRLSPVEVLRED